MDEIDLSNLLEDEDKLLKALGLAYFGLGLYLGLKQKPMLKREIAQAPSPAGPRTEARTLSEMIKKMIEEAYGIET
ncbi:MAG: hypothetical protein HXS46_18100 [Theionarchaea archaeon]|nr:hypothetical protein [Theionarchaea archaeon]